jgi:hypothetical protein
MGPQRGLSSSWTLLCVTQLLRHRPKPDALALNWRWMSIPLLSPKYRRLVKKWVHIIPIRDA